MRDFYLDENMNWELLPNGRIRMDDTCQSRMRRAFSNFWGTSVADCDIKDKSPVDADLMTDNAPLYTEDRARTLAQPFLDDGSIVAFEASAEMDSSGRRVALSIGAETAEGETFNFDEFIEIL